MNSTNDTGTAEPKPETIMTLTMEKFTATINRMKTSQVSSIYPFYH